MKIRHYSRRYLPEIRKSLQKIITLSHQNRLDSNSVASLELLADDLPHAKDLHLKIADSIRAKIEERRTKIEQHKKWIEQKAPGFFTRVSFVAEHITTWNLDLPAIRFAPIKHRESMRKKHPKKLTATKRKLDLAGRRFVMNQWYCFFFGKDHLQDSLLHEDY